MKVPDGWRVAALGEVVDVLDSKRIPVKAAERASRAGNVPYYGATGPVGTIDAALFNEPLLLLGEDGVQFFSPSKQKAYIIDGPAWVNNHAHVLRMKSDIERVFLLHWLNTVDYHGYANGTTRLKLTQAAMKRIPVAFPPPPEQRRIVERIEELFAHLDAADAGLKNAEKRTSALRSSWFLTWQDQLSNTTSRVGDYLSESRGGWSLSRAAFTSDVSQTWYIRMNNISAIGEWDLSEMKHVDATELNRSKYEVRAGDLLFNSKNSAELVGKTALASSDQEGAVFNENIMRLRFDSRVLPEFAWLWFNSPLMQRAVRSSTNASTNVAAVYRHQLVNMPFDAPPMEQQQSIVDEYRSLKERLDHVSRLNNDLTHRPAALRRSILAAAFEGHLI